MDYINLLPREILVHIFSYVKTETQEEFINNIAKVCSYWEEISMDSSFWRKFDGTLAFEYFQKFCHEGSLRNTEVLVFSPTKAIFASHKLEAIFENLPNVKCLNITNIFEYFERKDCGFFSELIDHCPRLCEIVFYDKCSSSQPKFTKYSKSSFAEFLKIRGDNITSVDFSNVYVTGKFDLFNTIALYCPNLQCLIAQNMGGCNHYISTPQMQNGLKKLKVLRLGEPFILSNSPSADSNGFPNLDTFTHPNKSDYFFEDKHFIKLLIHSPDLKVLDIRGCNLVTNSALCSLPANNLERLYVGQTRLIEQAGFINVLLKWCHSLVALDVSKMKSPNINNMLKILISRGSLQNLENLDLNNTVVKESTVKLLIESCPKLNFIQLESCRSLGRGRKRAYRGQTEIKKLLKLDLGDEI